MKLLALTTAMLSLGCYAADEPKEQIEEQSDWSVYVGALSYHFDHDSDYNETNELLMLRYKNVVGGYYKNSYYDDSFVLSYIQEGTLAEDWNVGFFAGAVTGYDDDKMPICISDVCAIAAVTVAYSGWDTIEPVLMINPAVASFAIRYKF